MKKITSRVIAIIVTFLCVANVFTPYISANEDLPFDDIDTSYAKNAIMNVYNNHLFTGTSATTFSPHQSITRAEYITVLNRLLKLEPVNSPVSAFTDVNKNAWYYGWIQTAVQLGLASGLSETTFAPQQAVTRQEAAVWMARVLKPSTEISTEQINYRDSNRIASWANESVSIVSNLGLMKGDVSGYFRPNDPITRQEAAVLFDRVLQNEGWMNELKKSPKDRIIMGWQYGQTTEQYKKNILKSNVNTLSPRWYFVGATGAITDSTDISLISWAKENNKQIWAMVGNRFDQKATHQMLSNESARNTAINALVGIVRNYGLDGLNLDFENVHPDDREHLTTFVTLLAKKLHEVNAVLSIDVSPDLGTDWTEAFDYASLGKQADYIVMMGYDEHYSGSKYPGSNASLPYIQKAIGTLLEVVSSDKVILAMPLYSRDWIVKQDGTASSSEYITLTEQNRLMNKFSMWPKWDDTLGQYVASYVKNSEKHSIWFEDARSLVKKYQYAVSKHIAGIAYWYIGGESEEIWKSMRNAEKYFDYSF